MSAIFQAGQELDSTGLAAKFTSSSSEDLSEMEVRYSIYQYVDRSWVSLEDQYHLTPELDEAVDGRYWVNWEIPSGQNTGGYQIRWDFRKSSSDMWKQTSMNFEIVKYVTSSPVRTAELSDLSDTPIVIVS